MMKTIAENDLILIFLKDRKYLKKITAGQSFHGKGGMLSYSELIGKQYGAAYGQYEVYEPTIEDILMYGLRRETQIVFPKDGFFVCYKLSIKNGSRVIEIGTGSGALTYLLSHAVGPEGKVVTYEQEERHYKNAKKNIERFREWDNVELRNDNAANCTDRDFDAAFIDVREPWECLDIVRPLLKASAPIGMIVPTANQISDTLKTIGNGYGDIEVLEIMLRKYKTVAERVRPTDRMIAHTGYLIFARKLDQSAGEQQGGFDLR
jgi:tRNA (adenine57-N1/adenine58-N1)-methyltransferase